MSERRQFVRLLDALLQGVQPVLLAGRGRAQPHQRRAGDVDCAGHNRGGAAAADRRSTSQQASGKHAAVAHDALYRADQRRAAACRRLRQYRNAPLTQFFQFKIDNFRTKFPLRVSHFSHHSRNPKHRPSSMFHTKTSVIEKD